MIYCAELTAFSIFNRITRWVDFFEFTILLRKIVEVNLNHVMPQPSHCPGSSGELDISLLLLDRGCSLRSIRSRRQKSSSLIVVDSAFYSWKKSDAVLCLALCCILVIEVALVLLLSLIGFWSAWMPFYYDEVFSWMCDVSRKHCKSYYRWTELKLVEQ